MYIAGLDGKSAEKVTFTADWERDIRAERLASFTQFWNGYNRGFYDPNFHGRDWAAIRSRYEWLLDAVETNDEFASLLRSEEHTSELQSLRHLVCRLLLEQ